MLGVNARRSEGEELAALGQYIRLAPEEKGRDCGSSRGQNTQKECFEKEQRKLTHKSQLSIKINT